MKKLLSVILCLCLMVMAMPAMADAIDIDACAANAAASEVNAWVAAEAEKLSPDQKTVNVFTWTYYIPDEVVALFEDATGITVDYTASMGGNEEMMAKIAANPGLYDLVVCSDYIIARMKEQDMLTALDAARMPNYANIDPAYQSQFYDPDNQVSIPYTNTIPLIVYNPDKVEGEVNGYADLWDAQFTNSLSILGEMRVVTGMAQKKLGLSYNETDPEKMAEVAKELEALKPNIMSFNDDTPHNALISGDATAGFMFGSQIAAAREALPNLKVAYPKEGLGFGIDNLIVPKDAPHLDATYIFLNYLLDGAVSAYTSSLINYGNCNLDAPSFLPESYKNDDTVNVPKELTASAEMIMPLDPETQKIYDDIWVAFRQ